MPRPGRKVAVDLILSEFLMDLKSGSNTGVLLKDELG